MKYYAIADIHGRLDLLEKAHEAILGDANPWEDYKIVTLGDYIDRGPKSAQVLDFLIDSDIHCLKGNHEDMMSLVVSSPAPMMVNWWYGNGGDTTVASYGGWEGIKREHIRWIDELPLYLETEKQVFVHAGIPTNAAPLAEQNKEKDDVDALRRR